MDKPGKHVKSIRAADNPASEGGTETFSRRGDTA
jgi:hypothetical protein